MNKPLGFLESAGFMKVLEIADENPDGFTATIYGEIVTRSPHCGIQGRWIVSREETQGMTSAESFRYAMENGIFIGGWKSPDGTYHWDASDLLPEWMSKDEAMAIGRQRRQKAIFDLYTGTSIKL
jgi:hypothetical protein